MSATHHETQSLPETAAVPTPAASSGREAPLATAPPSSASPSLNGAPAASAEEAVARRSTASDTPAPLLPIDVPAAAPDDERLWSVTTIIGALDRPALMYWAAEQSAELAVKVRGSLEARVQEEGEAAVIKWLRDARFRRPKDQRSAAELGTAVHDACESYALTGERPAVDEEVLPYVIQFEKWCQEFQPEYQAAELTVFSPTYGYAGTSDAFATVCGMRVILDYKSSRKSYDDKGDPTTPYPEVSLQLAAYRYAELAAVFRPRRTELYRRRYYLLSQQEREQAVPVPEVDGGIVLQLTPEHAHAYPIRCDRALHEQFLFVTEAARWSFETSKSVIGARLVAPARSAA